MQPHAQVAQLETSCYLTLALVSHPAQPASLVTVRTTNVQPVIHHAQVALVQLAITVLSALMLSSSLPPLVTQDALLVSSSLQASVITAQLNARLVHQLHYAKLVLVVTTSPVLNASLSALRAHTEENLIGHVPVVIRVALLVSLVTVRAV